MYGVLQEVEVDGAKLQGFLFRVQNPPKTAVLRLPTSQEMLDKLSQQRSIRTNLGRRKSKMESVVNRKADLDLFSRIRVDKGIDFDEDEAQVAINKLTMSEAISCEQAADQYVVVLKTPFGETKHTTQVPTLRDMNRYRSSMVQSTDLPHGKEEIRFNHQAAMDLYDAVAVKIEGYVDGIKIPDVPPHHKFAVVVEIVNAVDEFDNGIDPNS